MLLLLWAPMVKAAMDWSVNSEKVEVINLPPAEKAKWDAKLQPITDKWVQGAKSKGFPAEEMVAEIKMLIQKRSK